MVINNFGGLAAVHYEHFTLCYECSKQARLYGQTIVFNNLKQTPLLVMHNSAIRLTSIGLKNFQVFSKYTHIPLAPLTLIYGPNSAGKSAIFDAIGVASAFWRFTDDNGERGKQYARIQSALQHSFMRRTHGDTLVDDEMEIGVEISRGLKNNPKSTVRADLILFEDDENGIQPSFLALSVNGSAILRHSVDGWFLNISHPELEQNNYCVKIKAELNSEEVTPLSFDGVWLSLPAQYSRSDMIFLKAIAHPFYTNEQDHRLIEHSQVAFERVHEFVSVINNVIKMLVDELEIALDFSHSEPSRSVPTSAELTYLICSSQRQAETIGITAKGHPAFLDLARDCLRKALYERFPNSSEFDFYDFGDAEYNLDRDTSIDEINQILSGHLFLEKGYQLVADTRLLVLLDVLDGSKKFSIGQLGDFAAVVRLKLIDPDGRKFEFTEVGSGLGYILPVLVNCVARRGSLIEQPELHLHPALQAALGDMFIDLLNRRNETYLVETHSEYLLLRVLKRIRQTSSKKPLENGLQIMSTDVCVLYFDPQPEGTTLVKQLRVTEDGDFMDRWPRGFFEERDQDLFDE